MRNELYLVSIILHTYNSSRFLRRSIRSVLNQTYKKFELIIVDDCSSDNSFEIIKYFMKIDNRIKYYKTKKNSGSASRPKNIGTSKARGEYIAFLDADDYWMLDKLDYQMSHIQNCKLSFTAANYQHENSSTKSNFLLNYSRIVLQKFFMTRIVKQGYFWLYIYNPFLMSSAVISRDLVKIYKFNSDINIREDLAYWLEIFEKYNRSFKYTPKILLTITRAKNSITSNKILEFNKIINSISNSFFKKNNFNKFNYFLLGIGLRSLKIFLTSSHKYCRKYILKISYFLIIIYFLFFYSHLIWNLGENLIFHNTQKKTQAVFVLSGHQGFNYWNSSYQDRFRDILYYIQKYNDKNGTKFFLMGKLQSIPEQKIIESLMINEGIKKENIYVIYKNYTSSLDALQIIRTELKNKNISSITIITSPYHSLRLSKIWKDVSKDNFDTVFFKNLEFPKKNNYFQRAMNKKEILYEFFANGHYYLMKKFH